MSTPPTTEERVVALFRQTLDRAVPSAQTDLLESGLLDSLALVELLVALEQEFQVTFALDELDVESFRTVERIGEFVDGSGRSS